MQARSRSAGGRAWYTFARFDGEFLPSVHVGVLLRKPSQSLPLLAARPDPEGRRVAEERIGGEHRFREGKGHGAADANQQHHEGADHGSGR